MKKKFLVLVTLLLFVLTGCSKKEKEHDYSQDIDPYSTIFFQDMKYESEDYVVDAKEAPMICPVCQHDRGYYIRLELAPFTSNTCC